MSALVNIDTMRAHQDTARLYKWDVNLYGFGPGAGTIVSLRCHSMDQPTPTYSEISVDMRGFSKKEAGGVEWNPINFNVYENVSYEALSMLWEWGQKQFNARTGVQSNKSGGYEGTVQLFLLNLQDSVIKTWNLYGAILTNINTPQMTNDKAGANDTAFTVAYDFAEAL